MPKSKYKSWRKMPLGGVIEETGNAKECLKGDWRTMKPFWLKDKCLHCLKCWLICPEAAIKVKDGSFSHIDYKHCKGCGLCAKECPVGAIEMERE